jgi:hypothetical protein
MIGAVLAAVAALAVLIVVAFSVGGGATRHGCVSVSIPYSTGGSQLVRCGEAAHRLCASAGKRGGFRGAAGAAVKQACRKAVL